MRYYTVLLQLNIFSLIFIYKILLWKHLQIFFAKSKNGRVWQLSLEITSSNPCSCSAPRQDQLGSVVQNCSNWVLNISKDGDSTTSLDNLSQYSITITAKGVQWFFLFCLGFFKCLDVVCHYFNLCLLPLVLSLDTNEKS